jgi:hypothetical protein
MKSMLPLIFLLFLQNATGAVPDSNREELVRLLKERKERYGIYTESLSEKSGFFGNRTKNDIRNSSNKLVEILQMDNKIMNALQRMLDYKTFEKQNLRFDMNSYEERMRNLSTLNDTLNKQNLALMESNKAHLKTIRTYNLYIILLGALVLLTGGLYARKIFSR